MFLIILGFFGLGILTTQFRGTSSKTAGPSRAVLEQITIDIWAERSRSIHSLYYALNTNVNGGYKSLPSKFTVTPEQIRGRVGCVVTIQLRLIKDYRRFRSVCLFKDDFELDKDLIDPNIIINVEGVSVTLQNMHDNVNPVFGFVVGETNSVVKGYLIANRFYGTIRLYDKFRMYHILFYIEPIANAILYNPDIGTAITSSGTGKIIHDANQNAILFEYVSHALGAEWLSVIHYLPPGPHYSTEVSEVTEPTEPSSTTSESTLPTKSSSSTKSTTKNTVSTKTTGRSSTSIKSTISGSSTTKPPKKSPLSTKPTIKSSSRTKPTVTSSPGTKSTFKSIASSKSSTKTSVKTTLTTTLLTTVSPTTTKEPTLKYHSTDPDVTKQPTTPTSDPYAHSTLKDITSATTTTRKSSSSRKSSSKGSTKSSISTISSSSSVHPPHSTDQYSPPSIPPAHSTELPSTKTTNTLRTTVTSTTVSSTHSTTPIHSTALVPILFYHSTYLPPEKTPTHGFFHSTEVTRPGMDLHSTEKSTKFYATTSTYHPAHSTEGKRVTTQSSIPSTTYVLGHSTQLFKNTTAASTIISSSTVRTTLPTTLLTKSSTIKSTSTSRKTSLSTTKSSTVRSSSKSTSQSSSKSTSKSSSRSTSKSTKTTTVTPTSTTTVSSSASTSTTTKPTTQTTTTFHPSTEINDPTRGLFHSTEKSIFDFAEQVKIVRPNKALTFPLMPSAAQPLQLLEGIILDRNTTHLDIKLLKSVSDLQLLTSSLSGLAVSVLTKTDALIINGDIKSVLENNRQDVQGLWKNSSVVQYLEIIVEVRIPTTQPTTSTSQRSTSVETSTSTALVRSTDFNFFHSTDKTPRTSTTSKSTVVTTKKPSTSTTLTKITSTSTTTIAPVLMHSTGYTTVPVHSTVLTESPTTSKKTTTRPTSSTYRTTSKSSSSSKKTTSVLTSTTIVTSTTTKKLTSSSTPTTLTTTSTTLRPPQHSTQHPDALLHSTDQTLTSRATKTPTTTFTVTSSTVKTTSTSPRITTKTSTGPTSTMSPTPTPTTSKSSTIKTTSASSSSISTTKTTTLLKPMPPLHSTQLPEAHSTEKTLGPVTTQKSKKTSTALTTEPTTTTTRKTSTLLTPSSSIRTTVVPKPLIPIQPVYSTEKNTPPFHSTEATSTSRFSHLVQVTLLDQNITIQTTVIDANSTHLVIDASLLLPNSSDLATLIGGPILIVDPITNNVVNGTIVGVNGTNLIIDTTPHLPVFISLKTVTDGSEILNGTIISQNDTTIVMSANGPVENMNASLIGTKFETLVEGVLNEGIIVGVNGTIITLDIGPEKVIFTDPAGNILFNGTVTEGNNTILIVESNNNPNQSWVGTTFEAVIDGVLVNGTIVGVNGTSLTLDISPPKPIIIFTDPAGNILFNGTVTEGNDTILIVESNNNPNQSWVGAKTEAMIDGVLVNGTIVGVNGTSLIIDISPPKPIIFTDPAGNILFNGTVAEGNDTILIVESNNNPNQSWVGTKTEALIDGVLVSGTIVGVNGTALTIDISPPEPIIFTDPAGNILFNGTVTDKNDTILIVESNNNPNQSWVGAKTEAMIDGVLVSGTIVGVNGTALTIDISPPEPIIFTDPAGNILFNGTVTESNDTILIVESNNNPNQSWVGAKTEAMIDGVLVSGTIVGVNGTALTIDISPPKPLSVTDPDGNNLFNGTVTASNDTILIIEPSGPGTQPNQTWVGTEIETLVDGVLTKGTIVEVNGSQVVISTAPEDKLENVTVVDPLNNDTPLFNGTAEIVNDTVIVVHEVPSNINVTIGTPLIVERPDGSIFNGTVTSVNGTDITITGEITKEIPAKGDEVVLTLNPDPNSNNGTIDHLAAIVTDRNETILILTPLNSSSTDPDVNKKYINQTVDMATPNGNVKVKVVDANATSLVVEVIGPSMATLGSIQTDSSTPYHSSDPYEISQSYPLGMHSTEPNLQQLGTYMFNASTEIIYPFHSTDMPLTMGSEPPFIGSTEQIIETSSASTKFDTSSTTTRTTKATTTAELTTITISNSTTTTPAKTTTTTIPTTTTIKAATTTTTTTKPTTSTTTKTTTTPDVFYPSTEITTGVVRLSTEITTKSTTPVPTTVPLTFKFMGSTEVKDPNATTSLPTNFILSTEIVTKMTLPTSKPTSTPTPSPTPTTPHHFYSTIKTPKSKPTSSTIKPTTVPVTFKFLGSTEVRDPSATTSFPTNFFPSTEVLNVLVAPTTADPSQIQIQKGSGRRKRDTLFDFNNFFGENALDNTDLDSAENDVSNNVEFAGGRTSGDIFDMRSSHASICNLCIWVQPHFAEAFGLGGGLLHGISEIIDIIKLTNWVFRAIDFNQDGIPENIGFYIKKILLTDSINLKAPDPPQLNSTARRKRSAPVRFRADKYFGSILKDINKDVEGEVERKKRENFFEENYLEDSNEYINQKLEPIMHLSDMNQRQVETLLSNFEREPAILSAKTTLLLATRDLKLYGAECCATLGFMYHDMKPSIATTSKRGLCTDHSLGLISGFMHNRKLNKYDIFRAVMHSLGHLFGASHDTPTNPECFDNHIHEFLNPFPMNPVQQVNVGVRPNSFRFSDCAKNDITMFLSSNGASCLRNEIEKFCGNGEIDEGEACDCGSPWQCHLSYPCCGESDTAMGCKIVNTHRTSCHRPTVW